MSITLIILIVTCAASLLAFNDQNLKYKLMFSPYNARNLNEWYRVITHAFIHADWMHLLFNMFVLYSFGMTQDLEAVERLMQKDPSYSKYLGLEDRFTYEFGSSQGVIGFISLYVGGFLFATLPGFQKHSDNPNYLSLGASGAVSAVLFSYILINPTASLQIIFLPGVPIPAFVLGIAYMWYEIYMDRRGGSRIAHDAHIWGALFGIALTAALDPDIFVNFVEQIKNYF